MNASITANENSGKCEVISESTLIQPSRVNSAMSASALCSRIQVASIGDNKAQISKKANSGTRLMEFEKSDVLPFFSCMCLTYGRKEQLEESIEFFLRQDYKGRKQLVIFSDCVQQTLQFEHPEVKIINWPVRLTTMGQMRNKCIELCDGDVVALWDDDDAFLPGYLSLMARTLDGHGAANHSNIFHCSNYKIESITSGSGVWVAFRKEVWKEIGGYPEMNAGEDQQIIRKLSEATSLNTHFCKPEEIQFGYGWNNGVFHASGMGSDRPGVRPLNERTTEYIAKQMDRGVIRTGLIQLKPHWRQDWVKLAQDYVETHFPSIKTVLPPVQAMTDPVPVLSILMNVLNDQEEANLTIKSIRETAGMEPEIVVIDDGSNPSLVLEDKSVVLHRNPQRYGCGAARHLAACYAKGEHFLIIDSHMRFEKGWYEEALKRIVAKPEVVYCGQCMGLSEGAMRILDGPKNVPLSEIQVGEVFNWNKGRYVRTETAFRTVDGKEPEISIPNDQIVGLGQSATYTGATLNLFGKDKNKPDKTQVFEGVWRDHHVDDQEIPCLMGASYFVHRNLFFRLGGLKQLKMWGSDEPYFSLKVWLAGYQVRILRTVRIGHKFRSPVPGTNPAKYKSPYATENWTGIYNKIRCMMTLMKKEESLFLIERLKEIVPKDQFTRAMIEIRKDFVEIVETNRQYSTLFRHDLKWYCEKFKISYPLEAKV